MLIARIIELPQLRYYDNENNIVVILYIIICCTFRARGLLNEFKTETIRLSRRLFAQHHARFTQHHHHPARRSSKI